MNKSKTNHLTSKLSLNSSTGYTQAKVYFQNINFLEKINERQKKFLHKIVKIFTDVSYCHFRKMFECKGQNPRPLTCILFVGVNIGRWHINESILDSFRCTLNWKEKLYQQKHTKNQRYPSIKLNSMNV